MTTLLVSGGQVLHPDLSVSRGDVLVDQDTGTIEAVGNDLDGDRLLDATGSVVLPGLVNAHTHAAMTLFRGYADDKPLDTWLREDIWPAEAALTAADIRAGTELAMVEMIRSGTTTFADMYFEVPTVADAVEAAGMRAVLGHGVVTVGKDDEAADADVNESLDVAAALGTTGRIRGAYMPHSLTTVGEGYFDGSVPVVREHGVPVHLHANETTDEVDPIVAETGMRPLEYAHDLGLLEPDDFIAHGVHLDDTEISLLADTGAGVVHCPASNMKLASGMAPVQDMLDAGVTVALGTDGAASNNDLDLFGEMRDAAMVGKLAADDASAVAADAVVEMATIGGARALGFDSGRIEPGTVADLAVVDLDAPHLTPTHDIVSHLVYAARGSDVRHTICDGQVLMADRDLETLDVDAVMAAATRHASDLFDRVKSQ